VADLVEGDGAITTRIVEKSLRGAWVLIDEWGDVVDTLGVRGKGKRRHERREKRRESGKSEERRERTEGEEKVTSI
jgi:hypothetical protein